MFSALVMALIFAVVIFALAVSWRGMDGKR